MADAKSRFFKVGEAFKVGQSHCYDSACINMPTLSLVAQIDSHPQSRTAQRHSVFASGSLIPRAQRLRWLCIDGHSIPTSMGELQVLWI